MKSFFVSRGGGGSLSFTGPCEETRKRRMLSQFVLKGTPGSSSRPFEPGGLRTARACARESERVPLPPPRVLLLLRLELSAKKLPPPPPRVLPGAQQKTALKVCFRRCLLGFFSPLTSTTLTTGKRKTKNEKKKEKKNSISSLFDSPRKTSRSLPAASPATPWPSPGAPRSPVSLSRASRSRGRSATGASRRGRTTS